jgi:tRNA A37 threonylcarbamoyladenosine dehydratase
MPRLFIYLQFEKRKEMVPQWLSRTQLLLSDLEIGKLMDAHVLVVGLGGVGGICAEMIARAGVGSMTIVDADVVEASNRNRQLPALVSTDNVLKTTVMAERLLDINPDLKLTVIPDFINRTKIAKIMDETRFDYAVDCIDTLSPKCAFIKASIDRGVPIVSSMGAGGRVDPTQVKVGDIEDTYNCPLAFYVRKRLRKVGILKGVKAVYSTELTEKEKVVLAPDGSPKKSVIGTISYLPAVIGCTVASVVIRDLYSR